jgi:DNA-directed RNA polymerase subunit RPC12/RpoP
MATGLAPLSEVLDEFMVEQAFRMHEERPCSFKSHAVPVKAVCEMVCLACGNTCGYACAPHEKDLLEAVDDEDRVVRCRRCNSKDKKFTTVPLP